MKYYATFSELKDKGFSIDFVSASANYDMTAVVKLTSPDKKVIYAPYWIGDKDYRYADALNGILDGFGEIRFYDCILMLDEFKGVSDYDIHTFIEDGEYGGYSRITNADNWNKELRDRAKKLAVEYLTQIFN